MAAASPSTVAVRSLRDPELRRGCIVWAITGPIALLLHAFWFTRMVITTLGTLAHELGHALAGWLTGHPALPSFDLVEGGGITWVGDFHAWLFVPVWGGILALAWRVRERLDWCIPLLVLAGLQLLLVITGVSEPVWIACGPLGPVVLGAILLARALTNESILTPAERWVSGVVGWMLLLQTIAWSWALTHDHEALWRYLAGKRDVHNDLVRLWEDYRIASLRHLSQALVALAVVTPALVAVIQWCRRRAAARYLARR